MTAAPRPTPSPGRPKMQAASNPVGRISPRKPRQLPEPASMVLEYCVTIATVAIWIYAISQVVR